ncbi:TonB-dependent receptor [bacterium]|nr:TonB-dependent receptor [bacterium]
MIIGIALIYAALFLRAGSLKISGIVSDQSTGETIIGVNVMVRGTTQGTATDKNGYFVLAGLPPGNTVLEFRHIAYETRTVPVLLSDQSRILTDIALKSRVLELQDVSIVAERSELADLDLETGHRAMTSEAIRRIPAARSDVFRAIKHLPGIEGIDPISPLYVVRGSDTGENLILLDGVPVYNPYHYVSASGLFNVYALKDVELMVGGFGAEYGGRNGSVLYITTREGNNRKLHGEIAPSTTSMNAVVDFPVNRNATMMVSGRWYYDLFSRFLFDMPSYFYDMNGTLTWNIGQRNRLTLRYFHSYDDVDFDSETYFNYLRNTFSTDVYDDYDFLMKTRWRNQTVSAQLKTILSPGVYWQTLVYRSGFSANNRSLIDFEYETGDNTRIQLFMDTDIRAGITDQGLRSSLSMRPFSWNELKIGGEWNRYAFVNEVLLNRYSEGKLVNHPGLLALFCEDKLDAGFLTVRPGIRLTRMGSGAWQTETRLNAAWSLPGGLRLKAAAGNYFQYIVSVNTQEYELSQFLDTYYPLGSLAPSASEQMMVGLETGLFGALQVSLDVYHKNIYRTYTYDYNASPLEAHSFHDKLRRGEGKAYGFELLVKGMMGHTSGWVSYGWSRSTRRVSHIMQNRWHPFDYDRPHALKAVLNVRVSPALEYSMVLGVLSGMPKTLETGYSSYYYFDPLNNEVHIWPQVMTPVKNNIRMPWLLTLDFGVKKRLRNGFGADLARFIGADRAYLNVSIRDILFALHRNVWFYIQYDDDLYGVGTNYIPTVSLGYSIQF